MFTSKYKVKITGKNVRRFIKKIYCNGIFIEELETYDKFAYLKLDKDNYEKLLNIKTIYEIKLTRLYGLAKVVDMLIRYKMLICSLLIGLIYFLFLSCIIFKVDVVHSKKEIRDIIYSELKYYGLDKYKFVKSYNKKEYIEKKILENHKDKIEWLEIERIGVRYVVRVEERIIKKAKSSKSPRNIIAKKDGIIEKIDAYKGEVRKKIGDYVKKGDIIISGLITKNDQIKNKVAAEGSVYAETWYKVSINMPFYYNEINFLGNKRKVLKIKFINRNLYLFSLKKYDTYKEKELISFKNNILPISFCYVEEEKTEEVEKIYSPEEAIIEAQNISYKKLLSKLNNDEKIIYSKVLETHEYENYINVNIFYKIYENIGIEKEITDDFIKEYELQHKEP